MVLVLQDAPSVAVCTHLAVAAPPPPEMTIQLHIDVKHELKKIKKR